MKTEEQLREKVREAEIRIDVRRQLIKEGAPVRVDLLETEITAAQVMIETLKWVLGESGEVETR